MSYARASLPARSSGRATLAAVLLFVQLLLGAGLGAEPATVAPAAATSGGSLDTVTQQHQVAGWLSAGHLTVTPRVLRDGSTSGSGTDLVPFVAVLTAVAALGALALLRVIALRRPPRAPSVALRTGWAGRAPPGPSPVAS